MSDFGGRLTPEILNELMGLSTKDDQAALLQQQLLQAQALQQGHGQKFSTPEGAALGGIADVGNKLMGGLQQKQIMGAAPVGKDGQPMTLQSIIADQLSGRKKMADLLFNSHPGTGLMPGKADDVPLISPELL